MNGSHIQERWIYVLFGLEAKFDIIQNFKKIVQLTEVDYVPHGQGIWIFGLFLLQGCILR
jgi:hypothetical protein